MQEHVSDGGGGQMTGNPHEAELARAANLRDLGGVRTTDGRRVRRGLIFRSAMLDANDHALLDMIRALGLRTTIDLRANRERRAHPTPWEAMGCADYWCRDHDHGTGDLMRILRDDPVSGERDLREEMFRIYGVLPFEQRDSYRAAFEAIAAGRSPVLFHCAAGKDRTGVLAALILAAVDEPVDTIIEDYCRTDRFDLHGAWARRGAFQGVPRAALAPLLAADPRYLRTMFDELASEYGSTEVYLDAELGLDHAARAHLRDLLTEPLAAGTLLKRL